MDFEAIRDNLGLIVIAAFWGLSFLMRAARGKAGGAASAGPMARRRRSRRRAVILGFAVMLLAVGLWEFSRNAGGEDQLTLRAIAAALAVVAILAVLFAGVSRPGRAFQGPVDIEKPADRAAEIAANEPLEPS